MEKKKVRLTLTVPEDMAEAAEKLKNISITLPIKCGANGKVFGSVTNKEIGAELEKMGYDVDKKKIEIGTIKSIGNYEATLKLHPTVSIKIPVEVVAE